MIIDYRVSIGYREAGSRIRGGLRRLRCTAAREVAGRQSAIGICCHGPRLSRRRRISTTSRSACASATHCLSGSSTATTRRASGWSSCSSPASSASSQAPVREALRDLETRRARHHPPAPRLLRQRLPRTRAARDLRRARRAGGGGDAARHAAPARPASRHSTRASRRHARGGARRRHRGDGRTTAPGSTASSCRPRRTSCCSACGNRSTSRSTRARRCCSPTSTCQRVAESHAPILAAIDGRRHRARLPALARAPGIFRAQGVRHSRTHRDEYAAIDFDQGDVGFATTPARRTCTNVSSGSSHQR